MRVCHTLHQLSSFPVYSCAFLSSDELVLGGGGGQSRTGVKNKLRLYKAIAHKSLEQLDELELDKGEDLPMSMAAWPETKRVVCGINSSEEALKITSNQNCRRYALEDNKLAFETSANTLAVNTEDDDYQKVTVLSPDGSLVAVAGKHDLALLQFPSLEPVADPVHLEKGEIYDAAFSPTHLVLVTTVNLLVYALPAPSPASTSEKAAGKQRASALELVQQVDRPNLPGKDAGSSFRAARFHPQNPNILYTVINTVPPRTRTKNSPRRAFICKWDTNKWKVTNKRQVSDKGLTCFDVSANGKFVAYGTGDHTLGILDTQTLAPLSTILKAHELPPTVVRFNITSDLLVSGSADNTIRLVSVPDNLTAASWSSWIIVVVTLLVIIFAVIAQQMHLAAY
ncbi:uncharacterized protein PHACADRAFT_249924 [Phanerochaete carnosa HHB-10118-sp]|uniref:Uncharacterized protein n=1 Tax=Phanerochaete carnosa (strain HHB-10118-sp) TaxID=650164 RepID=K5WJX4_PHACS|nr:uncharacterized protein PHACADRAFT_249924 [Phanerochaete carnosa HHB-10118-sp]EKM59434.1 hypothetical protein PHACADRAFT_249924 [Phanerochaete carnosa HHB-10118-sp]